MSLLGKLFGRKTAAGFDAGRLREELLAAAAACDQRSFEKLCRKNTDEIVASFADWRTLPAEIRSDPEAANRYFQAMIGVARFLADSLGRREPLDQLTGPDDANPITQWEKAISAADELTDECRYREAVDSMEALLPEIEKLQGPAVAEMLATTLERLGAAHFHMGEVEAAKAAVERALALSEQSGDPAGIANNLKGLYEIERFLGHAEASSSCADRLSSLLAQYATPRDSDRWRRTAERVRKGEPLNRVVVEFAGERYELDDLARIPAEIENARVVFERNRESLGSVRALVQEGKELGSENKFEEAIGSFERAAAIDPTDPDPHSQRAFTLIHLQRYAEAAAAYRHVEQLAPGWYHCRSEAWLANQLALDKVQHAVFLLLHELEGDGTPAEDRITLVTETLRVCGKLPHLYLFLGESLLSLGKNKEAKAAFLEGLACSEEPDVETRLLLRLANVAPSKNERQEWLRQVVALNGNLVSAAMAALMLRHDVQ